MSNTIKRILGYTIGYAVIFTAIPNRDIKEFCLVTLGGCILIITALLFKEHE